MIPEHERRGNLEIDMRDEISFNQRLQIGSRAAGIRIAQRDHHVVRNRLEHVARVLGIAFRGRGDSGHDAKREK